MDTWDDWIKAGAIAGQARDYGKTLIKPGASALDVCQKVEAKIRELGGEPAFPAQVSMNDVAAHFCPEDGTIVFKDEIVSLDCGVHINGAIGDTAVTVDLSGKYEDLVKASEEALAEALKQVHVGAKLSDIGRAIHETIAGFGYEPVRNLSGHGLERYVIHTTPSVPNFETGNGILKEGMTIAIEPFATTGSGRIEERGEATVYSLEDMKMPRLQIARDVLKQIAQYQGMPFTTHWLTKKFSSAQVKIALKQLRQLECIHAYPPLVEVAHGMVSQAEHSVIVLEKPIITTKV